MSENDFQKAVLSQLASISATQAEILQRVAVVETDTARLNASTAILTQHGERITAAEQSTKAAHHRITGVFVGAGMIGTLVGYFIGLIVTLKVGK